MANRKFLSKREVLARKEFKRQQSKRFNDLENSPLYKAKRREETEAFHLSTHRRKASKGGSLSPDQLHGNKSRRSASGRKKYGGKLQTVEGVMSRDYLRESRDSTIRL